MAVGEGWDAGGGVASKGEAQHSYCFLIQILRICIIHLWQAGDGSSGAVNLQYCLLPVC